jgi:hypothetical protein
MEYPARYFVHYCADGNCGGEVLERPNIGTVKVKRIAVEVLPGKLKLFDTLDAANAWAAKRGDAIRFDAG